MRWARRSTAQHGIALRWGWYEPIKLATGLVLGVTAAFGTLQAGLASAPSGGAGLLVAVVVLAKAFDAAAEPSEATRSAFLSRAERRRRVQQVLHCPPAPWPQVNPYEIGVFDSVEANMYRASFDQPRPPYVPRPTVDAALHQAITDLPAGTGGVVVLQGHPKAGKSRTLWEALDAHESTNTRTVYALRVPDKRADHTIRPLQTFLDAKPHLDGANALIWIDDAHDHFAYGLTRDRLAQLVGEHAGLIVAMTVHTERLQVPRSQHDEQIGSIDPKLIVYLDQLAQITLELGLDDEEKAAARRLYPELEDSIEDPVDFQRLPSWFAGVSHLRDRYTRNRHQNLGGVAVAKAAIDWRRAGMPAGISLPQLRELACIELEELSAGRRTFTGDDDYANALDGPKAKTPNLTPGGEASRYYDPSQAPTAPSGATSTPSPPGLRTTTLHSQRSAGPTFSLKAPQPPECRWGPPHSGRPNYDITEGDQRKIERLFSTSPRPRSGRL